MTRTDRLVCRSVVKAPLIIVPRCSIELGLTLHAAHLEVTRTIARHLLRDGATKQNARPVYLSRTRLRSSGRTILGEEAVEQYCRSRGFLVVHPERMSLRNQVQLFNTHETFVGVLGSAFHSTLFRLVGPARHVYLYDSGRARPTYRLIDELMGKILNPLRDILHALHRREVQAERPSRPEKICAVIRRQEVLRLRGERQFARRHGCATQTARARSSRACSTPSAKLRGLRFEHPDAAQAYLGRGSR